MVSTPSLLFRGFNFDRDRPFCLTGRLPSEKDDDRAEVSARFADCQRGGIPGPGEGRSDVPAAVEILLIAPTAASPSLRDACSDQLIETVRLHEDSESRSAI
ncbi:unnamed protein product [Vitrella brassicaformis CCMP3155]|uniref:Uncharacterized protein n=1 Tax=Vitrella brassicaformis (strain CCMP3155) TaxID=1169540 RepID=A0A0G4EBG4_VITBC|nr:unnamed protein product [Vitrella brassicaformis CCMP3155]|eukprot:CEL92621.1 unnamed protein product [Vitrella brassicaformis CCMP3155]